MPCCCDNIGLFVDMGKLKIFEVVFNKDHSNVYQIGEFVTGYVRIVLSKPKRDVRGEYKNNLFSGIIQTVCC